MTSKRKFTNKGRAILGDSDRPVGIADILGEKNPPFQEPESKARTPNEDHEKTVNTVDHETGKPENRKEDTVTRKTGFTETHNTGNTGNRKTVKQKGNVHEAVDMPPKREEFKLPGELAERLRLYVFDTRSKKTHVVIDALDEYLKKRGY
jgi:hypothetical protein